MLPLELNLGFGAEGSFLESTPRLSARFWTPSHFRIALFSPELFRGPKVLEGVIASAKETHGSG